MILRIIILRTPDNTTDPTLLLEAVEKVVGTWWDDGKRGDRVGRGRDVVSRPPPSHTTVRTVPYTAVHERYLSLRCS